MKKIVSALISAVMALTAGISGTQASSTALPNAQAKSSTLVAVVDCVEDTPITSAEYDQYFTGTAADGVEKVLNEGHFYINGAAVPATEGDFYLNCSTSEGIWYDAEQGGWSYCAHIYWQNTKGIPEYSTEPAVSFEEARLLFVEGISQFRGSTMELYDLDGDGLTDEIATLYWDSALISRVEIEGETAKLYGVDNSKGQLAEGSIAFAADVPAEFPADMIKEQGIEAGDFVMYWYDAEENEWKLQRATAHKGVLIENPADDHAPYWIEDGTTEQVQFDDCLANKSYLPEFCRHTQFIRGVRRTGGYACGESIIMWTTPNGLYAFGFTRGDSAYDYLATAINTAETKIAAANVVVSAVGDGSDVPDTMNWVTSEKMEAYETQLAQAKAMLANKTASSLEVDAQIFALGNALGGTEGGMNPAGVLGSAKQGTAH